MALHGRPRASTLTLPGVRRPLAVLLAAIALLGAACGGDDDDADDAPDEPTAETTRPGGSAGGGAAGNGFCATVVDYMTLAAQNPVFTSETEPDPADVQALFTELRQLLDELEAQAPAELSTHVGLFASGTRRFIDAVEDADYDFEALSEDEALAELTAEFDEPAYREASQRLQAYAQDTCGVTGA